LLRALPADLASAILGRLEGDVAGRLRAKLTVPGGQTSWTEVDVALAQFFDLQRIAERAEANPALKSASSSPPPPTSPPTPLDDLKTMSPDRLARALEGEQVGTIALIVSCLAPAPAAQVVKRFPLDMRAEVAVRMTKLGPRNPVILQQIARAVAEKGQKLADIPPEPSPEEILTNLADMIRALPRAERFPVIRKMEAADPTLAAKVLEKLSRIEDLLKIPDRQLQGLMAKLDVKTIALALKTVDPPVRDKVSANLSSRARTVLAEESELLGDVSASKVQEAQSKVLGLIRKGEEDGEITMEE
jgi:flagellar motor switch protein FliG